MSIDQKTREAFEAAVTEWKEHCDDVKFSSNPKDYLNCDAYRKIVGMGKQVLPLVREKYTGSDDEAFFSIFGWVCVIQDITGKIVPIPDQDLGMIGNVRDRYIRFLDDYLQK